MTAQGMRFRLGDERVYRWEFDRNGEQLDIDVPGSITLDDSRSILTLCWETRV